jgi:tripartite-type tricarboxylate transporter receptor subunit TctC
MNRVHIGKVLGLISVASIMFPGVVAAQSAADFYKKARVTLVIGSSAGGGYDQFGRLFGRHATRHISGTPTIVPQNMPGASGVKATNYLYAIAPKDGSVIGTFNQGMPLRQILDKRGVEFDSAKFNWIGGMGQTVDVLFVWHTTGVSTIEDAKKKEVVMGALSLNGSMAGYPIMLNNLLGTKFRVVVGYRGGNTVNLAIERGEVQGRGSATWTAVKSSQPNWLRDNKVNVLVQIGKKKHPELLNVPLLTDFAQNDEQKQIFNLFSSVVALGRPFAAPPAVPSDRVQVLREAFVATMKDPLFIKEAKSMDMESTWEEGADLQKIVAEMVAISPQLAEKAKAAVEQQGRKQDTCLDRRDKTLCGAGKSKKKKR